MNKKLNLKAIDIFIIILLGVAFIKITFEVISDAIEFDEMVVLMSYINAISAVFIYYLITSIKPKKSIFKIAKYLFILCWIIYMLLTIYCLSLLYEFDDLLIVFSITYTIIRLIIFTFTYEKSNKQSLITIMTIIMMYIIEKNSYYYYIEPIVYLILINALISTYAHGEKLKK